MKEEKADERTMDGLKIAISPSAKYCLFCATFSRRVTVISISHTFGEHSLQLCAKILIKPIF